MTTDTTRQKRQTERRAATLTIHAAGEMTSNGRKEIARWLRCHADKLERDGANYAKRFTGRYIRRQDTPRAKLRRRSAKPKVCTVLHLDLRKDASG